MMKLISLCIELFFAICAGVLIVAMLSRAFDEAVHQQMDMTERQAAAAQGARP